jgi:hypothetical protein
MELPPGFAPQGEDNEDGVAPQVERSKGEQGMMKSMFWSREVKILRCQGRGAGDDEEQVLLLLKTVYGMMQGAYDWFYLLDDAFAALGYYQSKADSCVQSRLINGEYTLTSTHTDDVFGASTTEEGATEAKAELDRCFEIKDLGTPSIILGMKISQDPVYRVDIAHTEGVPRSERWNASEWPTATPNRPHYPRASTSATTCPQDRGRPVIHDRQALPFRARRPYVGPSCDTP